MLGNLVPSQKNESGCPGSRFVVERLAHAVFRGVISGGQILLDQADAIHLGFCARSSGKENNRRNALKHEGILIAANEAILLRQRVRADGVSESARSELDRLHDGGMLRT